MSLPETAFRETYFERIAASYPGLQTWISFQKDAENGGVIVSIFDRRVSLAPVYVFRMALSQISGYVAPEFPFAGIMCPGFSAEEYLAFVLTGEVPAGVK